MEDDAFYIIIYFVVMLALIKENWPFSGGWTNYVDGL